jgi:hypothetical protein
MFNKLSKPPKSSDHSNDPLFQSAAPKLTVPVTLSQFPTAKESAYKSIHDVFSIGSISDSMFKEINDQSPEKKPHSPPKSSGSPVKQVIGVGGHGEQKQLNTPTDKGDKNRRKFGDLPIVLDPPTDLYCEECERVYATICCVECHQVFCVACADLCHPRGYGGGLPHIHEVRGYIRPLQHGDTSRVVKDTSWKMPDTELHPEDIMKIRDISIPNSLAINRSYQAQKATTPITKLPKFKVNQIVLFLDPVSRGNAFGKIISEWDLRCGNPNIPALIRGEDSNISYIVEKLGLLTTGVTLESLLQLRFKSIESPIRELPVLGVKHKQPLSASTGNQELGADAGNNLTPLDKIENRDAMTLAKQLDNRIADMRSMKALGPKYHFRLPNIFENASNKEYTAALASEDNVNAKPAYIRDLGDRKGVGGTKTVHSDRGESPASLFQSRDDLIASMTVYNGIDIDFDAHDAALRGAESNLGVLARSNIAQPASKRHYEDLFQDMLKRDALEKNLSSSSHSARTALLGRALNVQTIAEKDLTLLEDKIKAIRDRKIYLLNKLIFDKDVATQRARKAKRFRQWWESMDHLRMVQRHYCARTIQTQARVWLCRVSMLVYVMWKSVLINHRVAIFLLCR